MKTTPARRRRRGYIATMMVLSTGTILSVITIAAYRRATAAQGVQSQVQLRVDYSEKEEAILRSIVAITPNRTIRAMQHESNLNTTKSNPLRWENIFTESLVLANARTSISSQITTSLNIPNLQKANSGDSALGTPSRIFQAISPEAGFISVGNNRSLGTGFPPPLTVADNTTATRDLTWPIISTNKIYGTLAQSGVGLPVGTYPNFNLLQYPQINFGYIRPGENFVAKRNWWAFSVDVADHDDDKTLIARSKRNFVLSIYEIPSQLAISAASYMSFGQYASGEAWQNVTVDGGFFAGKAEVEGDTAINALATRRGATFSSGTTVGGQPVASNPFAPGVREAYQVTNGEFFPVSLASESGRAAFIPISRGQELNSSNEPIFPFFDRFCLTQETNTISPTTWNSYSSGAAQCAIRMDITKVQSSTDSTPTELQISYLLPNGTRSQPDVIQLTSAKTNTLPNGYVKICDENQSYTFSSTVPVDVAYGGSAQTTGYTFRRGVTGPIDFNNANFGDPAIGTFKAGYWRPQGPYNIQTIPGGTSKCITVYPQRIPAYLSMLGGAGPAINNSIAVNVDYSVSGLNNATKYRPRIPCTDNDYGLIMKECGNLTSFTKGFSLVTNLRLYIGDDFNTVAATPPAGYTPAITAANPTGRFMPPCSLFAPEKRYGVDVVPFAVTLGGQIGSLASDKVTNAVRPLDSKTVTGTTMGADRVTVNLSQIRHPAEVPPISMMNWLVLLEERRKEFH